VLHEDRVVLDKLEFRDICDGKLRKNGLKAGRSGSQPADDQHRLDCHIDKFLHAISPSAAHSLPAVPAGVTHEKRQRHDNHRDTTTVRK
jgi:hypothetical protein